MKAPPWISWRRFGWFALLLGGSLLATPAENVDSSTARKLFKDPPRQYSTGPLWVWNDRLTEQQIRQTLGDLAAQHVKQVWVHPRPGLMTPYLSKEWFNLWKVALQEAERLDMNVWIYDENSYPSGFAGGLVPDAMPESRGRGLAFRETNSPPPWSKDLIAVYRLGETGCQNVSEQVRASENLPEGRYLVAHEVRAGDSPWHGNRCYVNLLSPGVTEKFLELTLEPYRREIGQQFGQRVPGVFTDEPNIRPAGGLPWSEALLQEFQTRWDYDLLDYLPSLTRPIGDWQKIRHNYFQILNEQFIEHWSKPYHDYCGKQHLEWTGHYWDHEWPNCQGVPDNMAMYAWHQRPAIDCLMNQYAEHTHAQFGNVRMVRELSSIANQLGMARTLCEVYGAGGWDLRFEDMKRIGDWLEVLGVNTLNQHLSYVTIRGARKRDHPQSFSYHEPWWEAYHVSADYLARVSSALSQGEQINRLLVLEPTTTAWMYQGDEAKLKELGDAFFKLLMALEAGQIEYDIGCEDVMARHGHRQGRELVIGDRSYRQVVIPPFTENLNRQTKALLDQMALVVPGTMPWRVDGAVVGQPAPEVFDFARTNLSAWLNDLVSDLRAAQKDDGLRIDRVPKDSGLLFHHRRHVADGQLLFLVNTSLEHRSAGTLRSEMIGAQLWDPYTGETKPYPFARVSGGISAEFDLPPAGSLLLFLSNYPLDSGSGREEITTITPAGPTQVRRLGPNVLTLDYLDVMAAGETRTNLYFYQANQFAWKKNGLDRDPWDSAVQFKDELIRQTFPAQSGFEATYRFVIQDRVPKNLALVIERPDLYSISCNGKPLKAKPGDWWLDKAFGRISLSNPARVGENLVTLNAVPFTMYHELEPVYVLGDFALKSAEHGFVITPDQALGLDAGKAGEENSPNPNLRGWNFLGCPFYSAGMAYTERFQVAAPKGRYRVVLPRWCGSVAKVNVNGHPAGYIDAPPFECEVTRWVKAGKNTIEVTVIGTLKNTLGPHHGSPALGAAWPSAFQRGPASGPPPGDKYSTVAYGLFEPFALNCVTAD